jgi:hypothetical protein
MLLNARTANGTMGMLPGSANVASKSGQQHLHMVMRKPQDASALASSTTEAAVSDIASVVEAVGESFATLVEHDVHEGIQAGEKGTIAVVAAAEQGAQEGCHTAEHVARLFEASAKHGAHDGAKAVKQAASSISSMTEQFANTTKSAPKPTSDALQQDMHDGFAAAEEGVPSTTRLLEVAGADLAESIPDATASAMQQAARNRGHGVVTLNEDTQASGDEVIDFVHNAGKTLAEPTVARTACKAIASSVDKAVSIAIAAKAGNVQEVTRVTTSSITPTAIVASVKGSVDDGTLKGAAKSATAAATGVVRQGRAAKEAWLGISSVSQLVPDSTEEEAVGHGHAADQAALSFLEDAHQPLPPSFDSCVLGLDNECETLVELDSTAKHQDFIKVPAPGELVVLQGQGQQFDAVGIAESSTALLGTEPAGVSETILESSQPIEGSVDIVDAAGCPLDLIHLNPLTDTVTVVHAEAWPGTVISSPGPGSKGVQLPAPKTGGTHRVQNKVEYLPCAPTAAPCARHYLHLPSTPPQSLSLPLGPGQAHWKGNMAGHPMLPRRGKPDSDSTLEELAVPTAPEAVGLVATTGAMRRQPQAPAAEDLPENMSLLSNAAMQGASLVMNSIFGSLGNVWSFISPLVAQPEVLPHPCGAG